MNMMNDLKQIEKDLCRELTNEEAAFIYQHGWKSFFEDKLQWDDDDYVSYRRLLELIVTYFTKNSEFSKLYKSKDFDGAFIMLQDLMHAVIAEDDEDPFGMDNEECEDDRCDDHCADCYLKDSCDDYSDPDYTLARYVQIDKIMTAILEAGINKHWLDLYDEFDPNHIRLIEFASDVIDRQEGYNMDEVVSDGMDILKDNVVYNLAEKLKTEKDPMELPDDIIDEVCDYLFKHENNVSVRVVNNKITVRV